MSKLCKSFLVLSFVFSNILIFITCSEDSSTETPTPTGSGINATDFAFSVGNEWNYNGTGYNSAGSVIPRSVSTSKLRIISETNSNGLNGYKLYGTSKNWLGNTTGDGEDFVSTENNGLWILEKLSNGSTSPSKILPFEVDNATIRSEVFNEQFEVYTNWPDYFVENIAMDLDIKFEYLGLENINVTAGAFNNCKKIKVIIDISQRSDTSGVELFNGKTWYIELLWWLSKNNGLIKTQSSFNCAVDSIGNRIWDPVTGEYTDVYKSILESSLSYGRLRYFDVEDLVIPVSWYKYKIKISGLNYLGKYITELSSKNF